MKYSVCKQAAQTLMIAVRIDLSLKRCMRKHETFSKCDTVEPRFNESQYKEVLSITNDILQPREIKSQ